MTMKALLILIKDFLSWLQMENFIAMILIVRVEMGFPHRQHHRWRFYFSCPYSLRYCMRYFSNSGWKSAVFYYREDDQPHCFPKNVAVLGIYCFVNTYNKCIYLCCHNSFQIDKTRSYRKRW